jgi:hypothetical protein
MSRVGFVIAELNGALARTLTVGARLMVGGRLPPDPALVGLPGDAE